MSKHQPLLTAAKLTLAQHGILGMAVNHGGDGKISWFPDNINGGARKKLLDGLHKRGLVSSRGEGGDWFVSAAGYRALNRSVPAALAAPAPQAPTAPEAVSTPAPRAQGPGLDAIAAQADAGFAAQKSAAQAKPRTRLDSKQAQVIDMLQRPEGATVQQICAATGWQTHTVRGVFAGAFKKKPGLVIVSEKAAGGARVYRVTA